MKITLTLFLLAISASSVCAQDPMAEALRKGIIEEDANHNLNAAIQAYQSVLTQFNADREAAATALFRLAECYRKQGKNDQAEAAYKRVIQDFGEQTKLADQSRRHLPQPTESETAASPAVAAARRRYREILQKEIDIASQNLAYKQEQFQLGMVRVPDTLAPERELAEKQRALAAFDAGKLPEPVGPPANAETAKARAQYRNLLQQEIELAQKDQDAQELKFRLGAIPQIDVILSSRKLLALQLQLAAFDMNAGAAAPASQVTRKAP
jgi:tetratricopeptide (TPR) repeat protein